jgi:phosphoglycolate phosphatase
LVASDPATRRYDLVVFDFDGTLADSTEWFWSALPGVIERFRLEPVDLAQRDTLRRMPARAVMRLLGVRWWQAPGIARHMRQRMNGETDGIALFDGVPAMLAQLREAGVQLAIVSSNSRSNVERILGSDAAACIAHFGCDAPVLGKKRHTRAVMRAASVAASRTLCVGDELRDADAARAAGAHFQAVGWGYTLPSAFVEAGHATPLDSPAQIVALVTRTPG